MRKIVGFVVKTSLVLAIAMGALFSASAQSTGKTSTTIQLTVIVPPVLQLSLNFGDSGVAQINGYLGDSSPACGAGFAIAPNETIALGAARLVSNLSSGYSIIVQSANGGALKSQTSNSEISYNLLIGGVPVTRCGDSFTIASLARTMRDGTELPVSIALGAIPAGASSGIYSDNLLFNVSAN